MPEDKGDGPTNQIIQHAVINEWVHDVGSRWFLEVRSSLVYRLFTQSNTGKVFPLTVHTRTCILMYMYIIMYICIHVHVLRTYMYHSDQYE